MKQNNKLNKAKKYNLEQEKLRNKALSKGINLIAPETIFLSKDTKLIDLISRLNLEDLVSKGLRVALDGNIYSDFEIPLKDHSEVAFLPPVSGG